MVWVYSLEFIYLTKAIKIFLVLLSKNKCYKQKLSLHLKLWWHLAANWCIFTKRITFFCVQFRDKLIILIQIRNDDDFLLDFDDSLN